MMKYHILSNQIVNFAMSLPLIGQSPIDQIQLIENHNLEKGQSLIGQSRGHQKEDAE